MDLALWITVRNDDPIIRWHWDWDKGDGGFEQYFFVIIKGISKEAANEVGMHVGYISYMCCMNV